MKEQLQKVLQRRKRRNSAGREAASGWGQGLEDQGSEGQGSEDQGSERQNWKGGQACKTNPRPNLGSVCVSNLITETDQISQKPRIEYYRKQGRRTRD